MAWPTWQLQPKLTIAVASCDNCALHFELVMCDRYNTTIRFVAILVTCDVSNQSFGNLFLFGGFSAGPNFSAAAAKFGG